MFLFLVNCNRVNNTILTKISEIFCQLNCECEDKKFVSKMNSWLNKSPFLNPFEQQFETECLVASSC